MLSGMAGSKDAQGGNQLKRKRPAQVAAPQKKFKQFKRPTATSAGLQTPERAEAGKPRQRRNADLIKDITVKWEKLRHAATPPVERLQLVDDIVQQVSGRVAALAMSHTASRVIQACAKHGSPAHRQALMKEVAEKPIDVAKSSYGHFLVCRLIALAGKEELAGLLKMYRGHIPGLLRHPCGAAVVDDLYTAASAQQRTALVAEFYGREFTLFGGSEAVRLPELLTQLPSAKTAAVLRNMTIQLTPIMEKALIDPAITHRVLAEYMAAAPGSLAQDAVQLLAGPVLMRMVHTRDGAAVACSVLSYGTAAERKKVVKGMAGHVLKAAQDEWAHLVLMCALSVVDDTALLSKVILAELRGHWDGLCAHRHGRRVVLHLLSPGSSRHVPASTQAFIHMPSKTVSQKVEAPDVEVAPAETTVVTLGVSKKPDAVRQAELLLSGKPVLLAHLSQVVGGALAAMLRAAGQCDTIVELCAGGSSGCLWDIDAGSIQQLHMALAACVQESLGQQGAEAGLLTDYYASRSIRAMVLASSGPCLEHLAEQLCLSLKGHCSKLVGGHAEKILVALLLHASTGAVAEVSKELEAAISSDPVAWADQQLKKHSVL